MLLFARDCEVERPHNLSSFKCERVMSSAKLLSKDFSLRSLIVITSQFFDRRISNLFLEFVIFVLEQGFGIVSHVLKIMPFSKC